MKKSDRLQKKKFHIEFSKTACAVAFAVFAVLGVWMIVKYYDLMQLAITGDTSVTPDASLPIAGITSILTPLVSYLLYQSGLKKSRNKYGIDADGNPFKEEVNQ